ncbi:ATP-binding protein [Micromonospora maritima]|uniref:ATP-binding protein n=1 Tax=Micromonospora maritima TaxID=986711 RepID=A0ABW7ZDI8_9ACTN
MIGDLTACRIERLRRTDDDPERLRAHGRDPGRAQRLAGLTAAYHSSRGSPPADAAFLLAWRRSHGDGLIDVYAGGSAVAHVKPDGTAILGLPPGGSGPTIRGVELVKALDTMPQWIRLAGIVDSLPPDETVRSTTEVRGPSLEDCLLRAWRGPFAWLLLAEPVPEAEIDAEAIRVADLERDARTRTSPEYTLRTARLARRHRELRQAMATGLWRVHLLAGGESAGDARAVAALLTASADLVDGSYVLSPGGEPATLTEALDATVAGPEHAAPFLAGTALVAAVAREPVEEIPGLQMIAAPTFDVTAERPSDPEASPAIRLGRILDRNETAVDDAWVTHANLNRHTFVTGATGSGKSQSIRALLEQASSTGLPWLVVEPAKAEYRLMAARSQPGSVLAIRPGEPDEIPAGINPLEPAPGYPLQTHADLTRALFTAAFQAEEPFPQVLATALSRCYEDLGWDLSLGEPRHPELIPRYPTLTDLQQTAERVVKDIGYGREVRDNVLGFIRVRLASLRLGTTGRFLEGGHPIDFGHLLARNVVFEIENVGDDRDKAFLMGTVLIRLIEHLRVEHRRRGSHQTGLRHLTVVEEAHRLLRRTEHPGPAAHAVELFADLLAEIRAYGEGLIVADQVPSKLLSDVIKNTAVKLVHRLPARDDRDAVGATMNLTEQQSRHLVSVPPGTGALFTDGMDNPVLVRLPDGTGRESRVPAVTGDPTPVIGRRSVTCGAACRVTPCTLRQMRAAQRLASEERVLVLWAELAVLAHLSGWTMPLPHTSPRQSLAQLPDRLRDCAISHAVDAAVASRSAAITATASPTALAAHVTDAIQARLAHSRTCPTEEPRWLARPYRWCLVHDALKDHCRDNPSAGRHPRSDTWAREYGRQIPGDDGAAQWQAVRTWFDADLRETATVESVVWGTAGRSAIQSALGATRGAPDWNNRLTESLADFIDCTWPLRYLSQPTESEKEGVA